MDLTRALSIACASALLSAAVVYPHDAKANGFRVVIDPGHGGVDLGTVHDDGRVRIAEKDVTLALALEAARELRARKVPVTLTRDKDQDLPLGPRTALANRLKADVFISIHMNSTPIPQLSDAQGIETFILNNTTDMTSKRLAALENMVLGGAAEGAPEQADVALILRDLRLDANLAESKRLACVIQDSLLASITQLGKKTAFMPARSIKDRGVKQALFYVLLGAEMPSILLEAGFLSHPRDRALVLSPQGRRTIARAIASAIEEFRRAKGTREAQRALARCKVH
ncbi:MAG: N-acetylmuramoyl-L-alanine amidase [Oligoflexia bacterium]|nr:N-acetylmuramoyl-L-alanine amidase [Oligoflexia bacterium]